MKKHKKIDQNNLPLEYALSLKSMIALGTDLANILQEVADNIKELEKELSRFRGSLPPSS